MEIIFRAYKKTSEVFALFPHCVENRHGHVLSYEHTGQHSDADYKHCISISRPAREYEYMDLKKELENQGYENLKVVKSQSYKKWLESYKEQNY